MNATTHIQDAKLRQNDVGTRSYEESNQDNQCETSQELWNNLQEEACQAYSVLASRKPNSKQLLVDVEQLNAFPTLSRSPLNLDDIRACIRNHSIPANCPELRAILWKMLLGYLPTSKACWRATFTRKREAYEDCIRAFVAPFFEKSADRPTLLKDRQTITQILKDALRTRPDEPILHRGRSHIPAVLGDSTLENLRLVEPVHNFERFCRVLLIFAKSHPKLGYIQGMNELLTPIFCLFFSSPSGCANPSQAEADAFFCFCEVLASQELVNLFRCDLDSSDEGVFGKVERFSLFLRELDPTLASHLEEIGVATQFYAFRWFLLLFTQEFSLKDTTVLWDHFVCEKHVPSLSVYIAFLILQKMREALLTSDFSECMRLLQNLPPFEPHQLATEAWELMRRQALPRTRRRSLRNSIGSATLKGTFHQALPLAVKKHWSQWTQSFRGGEDR